MFELVFKLKKKKNLGTHSVSLLMTSYLPILFGISFALTFLDGFFDFFYRASEKCVSLNSKKNLSAYALRSFPHLKHHILCTLLDYA